MSDPSLYAEHNLSKMSKCKIFKNEFWHILSRFIVEKYNQNLNEKELAFFHYIY
jgi:hypothetical protein